MSLTQVGRRGLNNDEPLRLTESAIIELLQTMGRVKYALYWIIKRLRIILYLGEYTPLAIG